MSTRRWVIAGVSLCIAVAALVVFSSTAKACDGCNKAQPTAQVAQVKVMLQTTCPVMGGKINKKIYADHDGKRVYFCCPACIAEFKKDPAKYIKQLEDAGVTLDKTPAPAEKK